MTVNDVPEISQIILKYPFSRQLIGIEGILPKTDTSDNETILKLNYLQLHTWWI